MKFVIVFCMFAAVIYTAQADSESEERKRQKMVKECMEMSGATNDMFKDADERKIYTDKPEIVAHLRCIMEKEGCIDHDGTLHRDVMIKAYVKRFMKSEEEAVTTVDKCMEETKDMDNMEKKTLMFIKCIIGEHSSN